MRHALLLLAIPLALAPPAVAADAVAAPPAREILFDAGWRFALGDPAGAEQPGFDDSAWRRLDLPHDWSIEDLPNPDGVTRSGPFDKNASAGKASTGWVVGGTGWYRKAFRLPVRKGERRVSLVFDGAYMEAEVWLNGRKAGENVYGYSTFAVDLTPHLNASGRNVVAVRVRNEGANSRWYSGSGLYRHVRLVTTGALRVPLWGVTVTTPEVSEASATVKVAVEVANDAKTARAPRVRVSLVGSDGRRAGAGEAGLTVAPGAAAKAEVEVKVRSPRQWGPESPSLYRADVEVVDAGAVVDRVGQPFGIRTVEIDAERGLRVNGRPYEMKGACVHHDNGPLGAAAIDRAEERRVEILKAAGFNAIRTSHNPPSPAFLAAADRLGLLVIDEAFDVWQRAKNPQDYHRHFDQWWERDLRAMVRRDRNHPSVVLWSVGNEINERADPPGLEIARRLIAATRADDPTRLVTQAICEFWDHKGRPWSDTEPAFALLDVGGYNYQWKRYEGDHASFPRRVMAGTESTTLEGFDYWRLVEKLPYVIGDFVWTGLDYLGESGLGRSFLVGDEPDEFTAPWPYHVAGSGDIDILGERKPQSYFREALWRPGVLRLAVHRPIPEGKKEKVTFWGWPDVASHWTWPGQEGRTLAVSVYSSCARVALSLDGATLGEKTIERRQAAFDVTYRPGRLEARCTAPGDPAAQATLVTAGAAAALRATADRPALRADRNDLAFVRVEVVDARGTVVPDARPAIRAVVTGQGELAGLASADPRDLAGYRGPTRRPYGGVAQAIVRPTGAGAIEIALTAPGLSPARVALVAR